MHTIAAFRSTLTCYGHQLSGAAVWEKLVRVCSSLCVALCGDPLVLGMQLHVPRLLEVAATGDARLLQW